jgi:uncharacterized protein (TIGR02246 family)
MLYESTWKPALLAALMLVPGCATHRAMHQDPRPGIDAANNQFMTAIAAGDAARVAAAYTEDGQLLPAHSDAVVGRPAIEKFWAGAIASGVKNVRLTTLETDGHGDMAHEVGRYTLLGNDAQVLDNGKYVVIWKREQDRWRLHRDIWTTNQPAGTR